LIELGCAAVLVTGADEAPGDRVLNQLFENDAPPVGFHWERLAGQFHGSGCTLSSACAAYIARGASVAEAVAKAQRFTWHTLQHAHRPGHGQSLPTRIGS
jgi:hydroxymethylpyrimidine/phosphomethylpyrimidine kinase